MKHIYSFLFFFLFSLAATAQHTLSGLITDKKDNSKLLEGVSVFIPEYNRFDLSKEGGTYILRNIGSGVVNVQFTKTGYRSIVLTVNLKDSATVVNVEMEPTAMELEEVVVTSNSTKLPDHIPYMVNSYSVKELNRMGNMNALTSLTYQPGVDKISVGAGISKPVIRGLSFNRILLYQNGTRLENQPWDDRHDIGVNENGVEKVEVVKGPSALIYGPDAMGGALIFVDEKPAVAGTKTGDVDFSAHSNTLGGNLNLGMKSMNEKGFFYSVRAGGQSHTSYIQGNGDEIRKNTEEKDFAFNSKFITGNAKVSAGLSKKWGVSKLTYSYYKQMLGIIELEEGVSLAENDEQREREIEPPLQDVATHVISSENTFTIGRSKLNVNVAFQHNDRKEYEPKNPGINKVRELAIALKLNTVTFDVKYSSDAEKKFGYTIGTQSYVQSSRNYGRIGLVPDADVSDFSAYGLIRYDTKKINFLAGGRYDLRTLSTAPYLQNGAVAIDKNFSLANGSVGLAYHPVEELTLKVNAASGFTAPNYAQLGSNGKHEGAYRYEIGRSNLDIEQNLQGDFGLIWELPDLTFSLSPFYNRINNYIYIQNTGVDTIYRNDTLDLYYYSQKNAVISGAEVSIDFHPKAVPWVDLNASLAQIKGEFVSGGYIPYIPANKLVGELRLTKKKIQNLCNPYISFVCRNYFMQDKVSEFERPTDKYTLLDFSLGGSFRWGQNYWDLTIAATNILNTGYFNALSLLKDLQPAGIREMGRNIMVRIRIPFNLKKEVKQS